MNIVCIVKKIGGEGKNYCFFGASVKGGIVNHSQDAAVRDAFGTLEETGRYSVRPVSGSASVPQKEGIYLITFDNGWYDSRFPMKRILRVKGNVKFEWRGALPVFKDEKDEPADVDLDEDAR